MIKAAFLDLDETLFLTQGVAFYIENEALRNIGARQVSPEKHRKLWGGPVLEKLKAYDANINPAEFNKAWHKVVKEYATAGRLDNLTNENRAALARLKEMRKKLFVVTSRSQISTEHLLEPTHPLKQVKDFVSNLRISVRAVSIILILTCVFIVVALAVNNERSQRSELYGPTMIGG